jgi:tRNA nucleotidyltransferase (CCA-adding enzyme)
MSFEKYVTHEMVRDYAKERINLKRDDVKEYREQLGRLQGWLREHIGNHDDYGFVKTRQAGSVSKGTALSSVNDMDLAVYVEAPEAPTAVESQLLSWMTDRLKEALKPRGLKDDQFKPQTHSVKIEYRGSGLNVDVVPVLYEGEADDVGYLITDTGQRVKTSVSQHLKFVRKRKDAHPDHFAQLVRITKWWVRQKKRETNDDFRFKSFMVELIWAHLADNGTNLSDYPAALLNFFGYIKETELRDRIAFEDYYSASELPDSTGAEIEIFDPVNSENNVATSYGAHDRQQIVEAANDAFDALMEAEFAEGKGRAVDLWQVVLGPSFRGAT